MGSIFLYAIGSGIACGIWTLIGNYFGSQYPALIATWVGFVGCTSFFVAGGGKKGFIYSISSNCIGILIGCVILGLGSFSSSHFYNAVVTGVFTFVMMWLLHFDLLKYATCTFMGGFSTFATGGNWQLLLICLLLGNILGACCDALGNWLVKKFGDPRKKDWKALTFLED